MNKKNGKAVLLLLVFAIIGQIVFGLFSSVYTKPFYESKFFATTGIKFDGSDLHKLNEGAHYFGQTMIGWTKFPSFRHTLISELDLPVDTGINMHMQERQNIIFTITTNEPFDFIKLEEAKDYVQAKIDEYNEYTNTEFVLTNVDYEQAEIIRSYSFGAAVTLLLSSILALAILFVRKEFFPPKLKL